MVAVCVVVVVVSLFCLLSCYVVVVVSWVVDCAIGVGVLTLKLVLGIHLVAS